MCSSSSHSVRGIVCHTGVCTCSLNAATKHAVGRVSVSVAVGRTYKEESRCKSALPLGRSHQPRRFCSHLVRRVPLPLTLYAPSAVGLCTRFPLTAHSPKASRRKHARSCVSGECVSEHIRCECAIRYAGHTIRSEFWLNNGTTDVSDELV